MEKTMVEILRELPRGTPIYTVVGTDNEMSTTFDMYVIQNNCLLPIPPIILWEFGNKKKDRNGYRTGRHFRVSGLGFNRGAELVRRLGERVLEDTDYFKQVSL